VPKLRLLLFAAAAAFSTCPAVAAADQSVRTTGLVKLAVDGAAIHDTLLPPSARRRLAATTRWGGTFTAFTGERVMIQVSDTYPQDPAIPQRWANFLASLIHGPELSTVNVYIAPFNEVQRFCGRDALACYSATGRQLIAPGDDPAEDLSAEEVVTHEYGHHVAASRSDAPWPAVDYGTKRWSSYLQVCARTKAGELFPGAESDQRYQLNPGEGFAESYRVLNERRASRPEPPWEVVSAVFRPDDTALALLEQDVREPWTGNTTVTYSASLSRKVKTKTFTIATPLDGTFRASAIAPRTAKVSLALLSASGAIVQRSATSVGTTVCGARTYKLRVTLQRGSGRVRVAVSKP
jgi:hypothetical protein